MFAEEVLLGGCREPRVRIRRGAQSKLVRIDTDLLFELQAKLQCGARILILKHLVLLELAEIQVALVPGFVVGELVVRR